MLDKIFSVLNFREFGVIFFNWLVFYFYWVLNCVWGEVVNNRVKVVVGDSDVESDWVYGFYCCYYRVVNKGLCFYEWV